MALFEQLYGLIEGLDVTIRIKKKNDKLTIMVLPEGIEKIQPLIVTGTPEELDNGFIQTITAPMNEAKLCIANLSEYQAQLKTAEEEKKKEADAAKVKKAATPPPDKKTPATKQKPTSKKSATQKEETEPDEEDTEDEDEMPEEQKPSELSIF